MRRDLSKKKFKFSGGKIRIGIVCSEFNSHIVDKLLKETTDELKCQGISNVATINVPGALEIPIAVNKLAKTKSFDVIIALGVVIKGETYHFKYVSEESIRGIMQISLKTEIPVISGILTVKNEKQAIKRIQRGKEFARSAIHIFHTLNKI